MEARAPLVVGRYAIFDRIAAGGMATVHLGRLVGEHGFSRTVAIKRLHAHFAMDPEFVGMFIDEARLAARIRHPNVVQTLDVVVADGEVFLVMDYVEGESLAHLLRILAVRREAMPPACAAALICPVLRGLHAAHEAKNDHGEALGLVHRDVSPQNILVGVDGVPRVLDFGVAKALGQSHSTREGQLKGKLAYMAPEQIDSGRVDRRTDVFAASVVLWEALTGRRLFKADGEAQVMHLVLHGPILPPSTFAADLPSAVDAVVVRGLSREPSARFATADEMADALEDAVAPMPARKVAAWVQTMLGDKLSARAKLVREIESASTGGKPGAPVGSAGAVPPIEAMDVTIAVDPVEDALTQAPSQASSISVETPRRASVAPQRSRLAPLIAFGGVVLCVGVVAVVASVRGVHEGNDAPGASGEALSSAPVTAPPVACAVPVPATVPPSIPVAVPVVAAPVWPPEGLATSTPTPTAIPTPTATATPTPTATATSNPSPRTTPASRPSPPPPSRPTQPAPQPSSKLYSRF